MAGPTITQALQAAAAAGLARLEAQMLLLHALGRDTHGRAWLVAHDGDVLPDQAARRFGDLCRRRADGEPVAYLTGFKEFFGLALQVDARVLDPRADTETLVEWALELMDGSQAVADLGTGSGAIALALQSRRPEARITAVDASSDALAVARANAARLGLPVTFRQGSWLQGDASHYHLIVSNPPYIAATDPHLAALRHEPPQALASGPDGLADIREIIRQAPGCLEPGGWLLLEHGHDQAQAVRGLLAAHGFVQVASRRDLAGIERCSGGQWPEHG
ncbi:MAG: peptide chain release factor N(5)-glutamine methyltransferase [Ramlibacter sp.]